MGRSGKRVSGARKAENADTRSHDAHPRNSPQDALPSVGEWEGASSMLHVTCDLCGRSLCPGEDQRYVVKTEVFPAHDPGKITEADLDDDYMEALGAQLEEIEDQEGDAEALEPSSRHFRHDLCPDCYKRFVRDPLGKENAQRFDFSEN